MRELSLLYLIAQTERSRYFAWEQIESAVDALTNLQRKPGARGFVEKNLRSARLMNDALIKLAEFDSAELRWESHLGRQVRSTYATGTQTYARALLEDEVDDRSALPSKQANELIRLFEARRLTDRDLIMLFVSSILGGLIGAGGALLAGG